MIPALLLLLAAPSGIVQLSPNLAAWKAELEAKGGRMILLARVYTDKARNELRLPDDTTQRAAFARILADPAIVTQLVHMHAMTVNLDGFGRRASFVLLNMARAEEWQGLEDPLIAHEFGHIDLHTRGYRAPDATGIELCEAVHSGDIVQHILIRREMKRRSIDYIPWMTAILDPVVTRLRSSAPMTESHCDHVARLAMWLDVSLGLTEADWPRFTEFQVLMAQAFPDLTPIAADLRDRLKGQDVSNQLVYGQALDRTAAAAKRLRTQAPPTGSSR